MLKPDSYPEKFENRIRIQAKTPDPKTCFSVYKNPLEVFYNSSEEIKTDPTQLKGNASVVIIYLCMMQASRPIDRNITRVTEETDKAM